MDSFGAQNRGKAADSGRPLGERPVGGIATRSSRPGRCPGKALLRRDGPPASRSRAALEPDPDISFLSHRLPERYRPRVPSGPCPIRNSRTERPRRPAVRGNAIKQPCLTGRLSLGDSTNAVAPPPPRWWPAWRSRRATGGAPRRGSRRPGVGARRACRRKQLSGIPDNCFRRLAGCSGRMGTRPALPRRRGRF
jgi:hypothetical protein